MLKDLFGKHELRVSKNKHSQTFEGGIKHDQGMAFHGIATTLTCWRAFWGITCQLILTKLTLHTPITYFTRMDTCLTTSQHVTTCQYWTREFIISIRTVLYTITHFVCRYTVGVLALEAARTLEVFTLQQM